MKEKGIDAYPLFKEIPSFLRPLRGLYEFLGLKRTVWYGGWKDRLETIDTIIVFSNEFIDILEYIRIKFPHIKIIIWYWNPTFIHKNANPELLSEEFFQKWSFDKKDCSKYGMRYNTTFYFDNIKLSKKDIIHDVVFLGANKGRKAELLKLQNVINDCGLSTYFHIVDKKTNKEEYDEKFPKLSYSQYLDLIAQSNSILDFVQKEQNGLTLRPMESLFFEKKLITNDKQIVKEDFYDPANIFVIGIDDFDNLKNFINSPYEKVPSNILHKYDVSNWISRFDNLI